MQLIKRYSNHTIIMYEKFRDALMKPRGVNEGYRRGGEERVKGRYAW
jgi:hypothetical protein